MIKVTTGSRICLDEFFPKVQVSIEIEYLPEKDNNTGFIFDGRRG